MNEKTKKNFLSTPEWEEFENQFEEGWVGNPEVKSLANRDHHLIVAEKAAQNLSLIFSSQSELFSLNDGEAIAQKAYDAAAKELYPNEKLWTGDNYENPEFWYEHLKDVPKQERDQVWNTEQWGKFEDFKK